MHRSESSVFAILRRTRCRGVMLASIVAVAVITLWSQPRAVADIIISTPAGLNPGDHFRIMFMTAGITTAELSDINYYNNFVNTDIDNVDPGGSVLYDGAPVTFLAIGSTATTNAIDNIGVTGNPVYLMNGAEVASSDTTALGGLWSGSLLNTPDVDLNGDHSQPYVWTGTFQGGLTSPYPLGGDPFSGSFASFTSMGWPTFQDSRWTYFGVTNYSSSYHMYGISEPLIVPIPEPSSMALACLAVGGLALPALRRRRQRQGHVPRSHRSLGVAAVARTGRSGLESPLTNRILASLFCSCAISLVAIQSASAVTIPTVPVGNLGNAPDPLTGNLYGSVSYDYRIGTTEVTNAQYAEFLNFKAASDPLALYNGGMGSNARGGITRSGVSGSFTYSTKTDMGNKPVNYVSWYDSIRFANWLHNGQGAGDTETGAYTILGGTATPSNGPSITRNVGATWFLTSEDEWYKAAYHQPSAQGGDSDDYWLYPTASNTAPTVATANSVGDISNPGANVANYNFGADWSSLDGNVTTVGSAGPLSDSYYGTADQGGNVWEWNESLISGSFRGSLGGSWGNFSANFLQSSNWVSSNPTLQSPDFGFRVASVPEPSTAVLAVVATGLIWVLRRRSVMFAP